MKKKYEPPMVKAIRFQASDIITSSGFGDIDINYPGSNPGNVFTGGVGGENELGSLH